MTDRIVMANVANILLFSLSMLFQVLISSVQSDKSDVHWLFSQQDPGLGLASW